MRKAFCLFGDSFHSFLLFADVRGKTVLRRTLTKVHGAEGRQSESAHTVLPQFSSYLSLIFFFFSGEGYLSRFSCPLGSQELVLLRECSLVPSLSFPRLLAWFCMNVSKAGIR